jgi:hypothetical protein
VFQNTSTFTLFVWFMHGTSMFAGSFTTPSNPGNGWNVVGAADVDGDGQRDLLIQNQSTGQVAYWALDGTTQIYVGVPRPSNPGGNVWKLVAPR